MLLDTSQSRPWWKEPMVWLIAGLPAIAVVASFTTYFIAAHDPDSLVTQGYRKEGFAVVAPPTPADQKAAALGLSARIYVRNGQMEVVLHEQLVDMPKQLALTIEHPGRENQDLHILLARAQELSYIAPAPAMGSGKRILVLEPEDRAWRIRGQWMAPFSGMTELVAVANIPSTHP